MSQAEFLLGFVAIIVGLAIANLAESLHRLLRARGLVRWHWFPAAAALLLILLTVELWWSLAGFGRVQNGITIGSFLPLVLALMLLYLTAAAALPDDIPAEGLDLRDYYFDNRRYFWLMFALLIGVFALQRLGTGWAREGAGGAAAELALLVPNLVLVALFVSLAFVRKAWWHGLWLMAVPILLLASILGRPLAL